MTPELARPVMIERIGPLGLEVEVVATAGECTTLAARLHLPAVIGLTCRFRLSRCPRHMIMADGSLIARVMQTCVVSLEDFESTVAETFTVCFVPEGSETEELSPDEPDEIGYSGPCIDLGDVAAEQLALVLDPYPRKPDAVLPEGGDSPESHPFAALARMRRH
ncbi:MAG: DUF177 domain-containing protein [Acetobacteraceae bacterium]